MLSPKLKRPTLHAVSFALIFGLLLLTACTRKSAADPVVDAAIKRYDRVQSGMTKEEAVALLGEPSVRKEDSYRWQTAGQPPNNASIEVKFNREGRITSIARSRAQN